MDGKILLSTILFLVPSLVFISAWSPREERRGIRAIEQDTRRTVDYYKKRHMIPGPDSKRWVTTQRAREFRKKPSGHLTPLKEDDIDDDRVISVAIGPPPIRPKYEKDHLKQPPKPVTRDVSDTTASNLVKDVLAQLGREFLTRQVSEDFIFGQYVGNAMQNLTADKKLRMQHEVLELIVKYQKLNRGEGLKSDENNNKIINSLPLLKDINVMDKKFSSTNETEDTWSDFSNLAKIVG